MATSWTDLRPEDFDGKTSPLFDMPNPAAAAAARQLLDEPGTLFADEPEPWPTTEDGRPLAVVDVLGADLFDYAGAADYIAAAAADVEDQADNAGPRLRLVPDRPTVYVIPCSRQKLDKPAPARDLYTGAMFRHTLEAATAAAERDGGRVLILSAKHGLVDPDRQLAPYDTQMGTVGSVWSKTGKLAEQAKAFGIGPDVDVMMLLPRSYATALDRALRLIGNYPQDLYEGCSGIGDQRHVNAVLIGAGR